MNHFIQETIENAFQRPGKAAPGLSPVPEENVFPQDETYAAHLAAIIEFSDDAIISRSLDGAITSWNKGSEKMFGYTAKEAIGKSITMLIPPAFLKEEKSILDRIRNNETVEHFETVRLHKNGDLVYVSLTVSPLKNSSGAIVGVSKIARNISSRKISLALQNSEKENRAAELAIANRELIFQNSEKEKRAAELVIANNELVFQSKEKENRAAELVIANKELIFQNNEKEKRAAELIIANIELENQNREKEVRAAELILAISELKDAKELILDANKELEAFSYSVSHDLRVPLRAINGYTKMLKLNFSSQLDPEANRLMNNIVHHANKMGQLIDDLLTFSRVGRRELVKSTVSIQKLVDEVWSELKHERSDRSIELKLINLLPACADRMAMKQVWLNLISNAIKYTNRKEEAQIEITSAMIGNEITYSIKDNGAGFDMRYVGKLFGVFQRLHSEEEFEGTGVGLALVHRIISKHGGRIWAESTVNKGAEFHFTINKT